MRNPIRIVTVRNYRSNESWRRSVEKLNYSFDRRINCQTLDKLLFSEEKRHNKRRWSQCQCQYIGIDIVIILLITILMMMMRWQESNTKSEAKDFPNLVSFCWDKWDGLGLVRKRIRVQRRTKFSHINAISAFSLLFVIYGEDK